MKQGHIVTLFSHDTVNNVPEGVKVCDAKKIPGGRLDEIFRYAGHGNNVTLFSDIFAIKAFNRHQN